MLHQVIETLNARVALRSRYDNYIGGKWVAPVAGAYFDNISPITGKPVFLPGNQSIKLNLSLKPHWDYSFTLTPQAFASPEGYPLESFSVSFRTR